MLFSFVDRLIDFILLRIFVPIILLPYRIIAWPIVWMIKFRPPNKKNKMIRLSVTVPYETADFMLKFMIDDYMLTRDDRTLDVIHALCQRLDVMNEYKALANSYPAEYNIAPLKKGLHRVTDTMFRTADRVFDRFN
jgi:hypothetical protein